ncbi:MAG TPA: hypothetical protein PLW86_05140, partial [Rhodocyclaceae bacterium]|nr:hypothetical protein [Rhodocyclaceae bacterium]
MTTPRFRPNSIIELDDPFTGDRHLGLVCDNGIEFFDVMEDGATPLPILAELCPVSLGDDSDWSWRLMESGDVPKWHAFDALVDA